jgi:HPt (histidine-containing phosphotransfer) domain-containing protein
MPLSRSRKRKSPDFLRRSVDIFLREAPARVEELWAAGRAEDLQRVAIAAHTLKCLSGNFDASPLSELAEAAEKAAEGGKLEAARLTAILFDLEIAYAETRAGLQRANGKSLSAAREEAGRSAEGAA